MLVPPRFFTALLLATGWTISLLGCTRPANDDAAPETGAAVSELDPRMRRLAAEHPDSVVGVFVRVTRPVGPDERDSLESAGLNVGTVAGDIVTGRMRARSAERLTLLEFVRYIQLAGTIRVPDSLPDIRPDTPSIL